MGNRGYHMPYTSQIKPETAIDVPEAQNSDKRSNSKAVGLFDARIWSQITGMVCKIIIRDLCQNAVDACYHWANDTFIQWAIALHNKHYGALRAL